MFQVEWQLDEEGELNLVEKKIDNRRQPRQCASPAAPSLHATVRVPVL
jgi:hypothetical protein